LLSTHLLTPGLDFPARNRKWQSFDTAQHAIFVRLERLFEAEPLSNMFFGPGVTPHAEVGGRKTTKTDFYGNFVGRNTSFVFDLSNFLKRNPLPTVFFLTRGHSTRRSRRAKDHKNRLFPQTFGAQAERFDSSADIAKNVNFTLFELNFLRQPVNAQRVAHSQKTRHFYTTKIARFFAAGAQREENRVRDVPAQNSKFRAIVSDRTSRMAIHQSIRTIFIVI
jgi:hypothetical protein